MYRRRKVNKDDKPPIPTSIEGFNMVIKEDLSLRDKDEDTPYDFQYLVKDQAYNDQRYRAFMNLIGDVVEEKLQAEPYNFQKLIVPLGADPTKDVHSYIFMTPNALTTTDKLIVFMPGNNTRIGIWSNRVVCDETIRTGSMMQITELVKEKGYEVIILNPNANYWYNNRAWEKLEPHATKIIEVPGSENADNHVQYVFHNILRNVKAEKIAVIARGWAGTSFTVALNNEFDFIKDRIKAVAMTDSTHMRDTINGDAARVFMLNNCVSWAVSTEIAKGETIQDVFKGCTTISSGLEITDFVMNEMLDDIMKFIFIKMGNIEPTEQDDDEDEDEDDLANRELTQEERAALGNMEVLSVE